jgi:predicted nucleic acid-binding protein
VTLLDTNAVVRFVKTTDPAHPVVKAACTELARQGRVLCIAPQILYEFWVVATRPPAVNGLGLSIPHCQHQIALLKQYFRLLPDLPNLLAEWESLVGTYQCSGKVAHDARLVAAMRTHGVTRVLTFNTADFARYPGLAVLDPAAVPPPGP